MNKTRMIRRGLPYGWWKHGDIWWALFLAIVLTGLLLAWFLDLKPVW